LLTLKRYSLECAARFKHDLKRQVSKSLMLSFFTLNQTNLLTLRRRSVECAARS